MAKGTLELVGLELGRALQPLEDRLAAGEIRELFAELGLQFPPALEAQGGFVNALTSAASSAAKLGPLAAELAAAIEAEDLSNIVRKTLDIIDVLRTLIPALDTIGNQLQSVSGALPGLNPADVNAFAAQLPGRLLDYILVNYLEGFFPILLRGLTLLGLVERVDDPGDPGDPAKPPFTKRRLRLDVVGDLITSPDDQLRALYGWGDAGFDGKLLLDRLHDLLSSLSIPASYDPSATPPALRLMLLRISPRTDIVPPGLEVVFEVSLPAGLSLSVPVFDGLWAIELDLQSQLDAGLGVLIQPPANLSLIPPAGSVQGQVAVGIARLPKAPETAFTILGAGDNGIQAQSVGLKFIAKFAWDGAASQARGDFGFEGEIKGGKLKVSLEEADGFLGTLLAGAGIDADFGLGFGWTAGHGFYFTGSSSLEIQLPLHITLGPVEVSAVTFGIGISGTSFPVSLSADFKAALGPLQAVVEQVGFSAIPSFPGDKKGNLGPVQLDFGFKPPKGVGLVVDAGVIKGGGYLFFDFDKGEYAGALELMFSGIVSLKAIGLITTKMPDGSKGFSLLIIITAEFGTGIQLGFGFTLLGVGGLLGLNRTVRLEQLAEGVRTGAVNNIMFPQDVVANAPRIISDLRAIFPPEQGKFLIGPMAKLGWGTPPLISLSLGIIIEIPGNLAILGVLRCILPTEDAAILVLQVAFVGAIEFDKKRLWLFAGLFESRVLFITLEGEMGVLAAFGDDANFVISVGGFHPRFTPPPLPFPVPNRLALDLLNEPGERIRIEGYFAVTTNTVQFGAHAELVFGFDDFGLHGHLGFDALFQFSPFYYIIQISADLSLDAFGVGLLSVDLDFSLEGPTPNRAHGRGSVSLLFFDISADFDITWGESRDTTLPAIDIMPPLAAEFDKLENWKAFLPATTNLLVSLRHLDATSDGLVLHPLGTLRVTQRYVPLDSNIDKVGTQKAHDAKHFTLQVTSADLVKTIDVPEMFAPAQFHDMSNADKLSKPAYLPEHGGLELSAAGQQLNSSEVVKRIARYEQIIIDTNFKRFAKKFRKYSGVLFDHFLKGNAISKSTLSVKYKQQMQPFQETIKAGMDSFAVAFTDNNKAYKDEAVFTSVFAAQDYMVQAITADPGLTESLHVIPHAEVNRTA